MIYRFDGFEVDVEKHSLKKNGQLQKIEPQVFEILVYFLSNKDRLVTKEDLHKEIWKDRIVSEAAVNSRIRSVRNAIDDDGSQQRLIKTIHGRGFRFVGRLDEVEGQLDEVKEPSPTKAQVTPNQVPSVETRDSRTPKRGNWLVLVGLLAVLVTVLILNNHQSSNIREITVAAPAEKINAIAVLPFRDMSAEQNMRYLADGFSEELLNLLAQVDGLQVSSRSSTFAFRDSQKSLKEIGEALNVTHLLDGSVRKVGDQARITVQLVDTRTDTQQWSRTYDRDFDAERVFKMQDDIADNIVGAISADLSVRTRPKQTSQSKPAHEALLRANELRQKETRSSLVAAIQQYDLALSNDPDFAQAFAGKAEAQAALLSDDYYGASNQVAANQEMLDNLRRALELAPNDPVVLVSAASLRLNSGRYLEVLELAEKVLTLEPNSAAAFEYRGAALLALNRLDDAQEALLKARNLNPLSSKVLTLLGDTRYLLGDVQGAFNVANDNFKWNFDKSSGYELLIYLNRETADYAAAHQLIHEALEIYPDDQMRRDELISLYSQLGLKQRAIEVANTPHLRAWALAINGEREAAKIAVEQSTNGQFDRELMLMVGDYKRADQLYTQQTRNVRLAANTTMPVGSGRHYVETCFLKTQLHEAASSPACEQLKTYYSDKSPDALFHNGDLLAGIAWHLIQERPDKAVEWLAVLVKRGAIFLHLLESPLFEALSDHPKVPALVAEMTENAAYHRRLINNQDQSRLSKN